MGRRDITYYADIWNKINRRRDGGTVCGDAGTPPAPGCWDERAGYFVKKFGIDSDNSCHKNRMLAISALLREKGCLGPEDDVIDIGCGPGFYATEFARTARHVTGTDISSKMLEYGLEHSKSLGISNVSFLQCDFKSVDIAKMGWEKAFDLAFSSITPALYGLEAIQKMARMSRKICFHNMMVYMKSNIYSTLRKTLLGEEEASGDAEGENVYSLFNMLWLSGYHPELSYRIEKSEDTLLVDDDLVDRYAGRLASSDRINDSYRKDVRRALLGLSDKGVLTNRVETMFAFVLWEV